MLKYSRNTAKRLCTAENKITGRAQGGGDGHARITNDASASTKNAHLPRLQQQCAVVRQGHRLEAAADRGWETQTVIHTHSFQAASRQLLGRPLPTHNHTRTHPGGVLSYMRPRRRQACVQGVGDISAAMSWTRSTGHYLWPCTRTQSCKSTCTIMPHNHARAQSCTPGVYPGSCRSSDFPKRASRTHRLSRFGPPKSVNIDDFQRFSHCPHLHGANSRVNRSRAALGTHFHTFYTFHTFTPARPRRRQPREQQAGQLRTAPTQRGQQLAPRPVVHPQQQPSVDKPAGAGFVGVELCECMRVRVCDRESVCACVRVCVSVRACVQVRVRVLKPLRMSGIRIRRCRAESACVCMRVCV
jgi:hypothetical protein